MTTRCSNRDQNGQRCWLEKGHTGKHCRIAPVPASPDGDDLVAQIHAFLADTPKGQLHTGYRYGELLEQAVGRITELELRRDVISDVQNKQLRHAEAENAKLRAVVEAAKALRDAGVNICQQAVQPDCMDEADALNELIGLFDGPIQRAFDATFAAAQGAKP